MTVLDHVLDLSVIGGSEEKLYPRLALQVRRQGLLFKFIGCGALTHQALHMCANLSRLSSFNVERECLECREGAEALARGSAPSPRGMM